MTTDCYVFGYGSLINPLSVNRTLGRAEPPTDLRPAALAGFQRCWQLLVHRRFTDDPPGVLTPCIVLDIVRREGGAMNGVLVPISRAELALLDVREAKYDRVDVTDRITPAPDRKVYTYIGKAKHTRPPADAVIAGVYMKIITDAYPIWGEDFAERFEATTLAYDWPIRDGPCDYPNRPT